MKSTIKRRIEKLSAAIEAAEEVETKGIVGIMVYDPEEGQPAPPENVFAVVMLPDNGRGDQAVGFQKIA